jgi:uncharacterized protein YodC (DUF2158 family)
MELKMQDVTFKPGDLVRLRSGGPLMTASSTMYAVKEPFVHCAWFDVRDVQHSANFKVAAIRHVDMEDLRSG